MDGHTGGPRQRAAGQNPAYRAAHRHPRRLTRENVARSGVLSAPTHGNATRGPASFGSLALGATRGQLGLTPRETAGGPRRQTSAVDTGDRAEMLRRIADAVMSVPVSHPTRVAVDGRPASGKTTLSDELAALLRDRGRPVIRATIDEFMHPKSIRYSRGVDSPEGCYHDSFDFDALHDALLRPLGPRGSRRFRTRSYDRDRDLVVSMPIQTATVDTVLLFDGVFLMRPELNASWDLRILVSTSFEESLRRALRRDVATLGSAARVEERFRARYLPSQEHYFDTVKPTEAADVIVENDHPERPSWLLKAR